MPACKVILNEILSKLFSVYVVQQNCFDANQAKNSMLLGQSTFKIKISKNTYHNKIIPQQAVSPLGSSGG